MPVSRDETMGQWVRRDRRADGVPDAERPSGALADGRTGAAAHGPPDVRLPVASDLVSDVGRSPLTDGARASSLGAKSGVGRHDDVPTDTQPPREASRGAGMLRVQAPGVLKDESRDLTPFVIGGFGGPSSDGTESWSKVPRRRRSASPVLSKRTIVRNDNSFASLSSLRDTSLVTKDDDDIEYNSPEVPEVPSTPKKAKGKGRASLSGPFDSDSELEAVPETPTPVDKSKREARKVSASLDSTQGLVRDDVPEFLSYMGLEEAEIDVGAQRAALDSLKTRLDDRGLKGLPARSESSMPSSNEPLEDIMARARDSATLYKETCEREVREAWKERDTASQARLEAERSWRESEDARLKAERRLDDVLGRLDRLTSVVESQASEIVALRQERSWDQHDARDDSRRAEAGSDPRVGFRDGDTMHEDGGRSGIHGMSTSRPVVSSVSAIITAGRKVRTSVAPPSQFISPNSSLGQTLERKLKQLNDAMRMLERAGASVVKPNIKPEAPKAYDGRDDLDAFQRYVEQSVEYLIDGLIIRERHVSKLGHFLEKDAQQFFKRVVKRPEEWDVREFFNELFNYCFPDGFMNAIRNRWHTWRQLGSTVKVYAATMEGFRDDLGDEVSDRQFIHRFWQGLNDDISRQLYLDRLHPDINSYDEVLEGALVAERAINNSLHVDGSTTARSSRNGRGGGASGGNQGRQERGKATRGGYAARTGTSGAPANGSANESTKRRDGAQKRDSPLSREQIKEHLENNLCFKCHKAGHMSRNCPAGQQVKSDSKGHAPGSKTSYAVHFTESELDDEHGGLEEDEEPEVLEELHCGSVHWRLDSDIDVPQLDEGNTTVV
ncbi:hypothetical protein PUNSTDRAFT_130414 [Punctularia strigosozonata HHB-11173 SS5]|uniref:uncharacterized protein n=1 Tax=Punctularia strigosozonata (strain HHB-11173) TaxID=741275 RepID=UPI00044184C8|nr:uncharacterized protein PUNSTDRAFT_130414 [Punctularia strigosozonata HHB-11173 SS5]EIN12146.1 hypothetical protein PUNSTDRAFT_130414 [Punctularia strigosozonata HHB-11173 SS5]